MGKEQVTATYEKFIDGRPKFRLEWTNHTKQFFIDDKEVSEEVWITGVKENPQ